MRFSEGDAMRALIPVLLAAVHLSAQTDKAPVFRSGVEVMEVDVTVVDGQGRPIRDLRAPEFTVTVDGQPRRVVSAEFISESTNPSQPPPARDPYVSNNTDRNPGRLIMLVVDRNNIDTHTVRQSLAPMKSFVTSLGPDDRVALATIPPPGPMVDFTTNHAQILDAIGRIVGKDEPIPSRFNISDFEALAFDSRSNPIAIQRLLYRVCGDTDPTTLSNCDRDVEQEAMTLAAHLRQSTTESVSGFAALLKSLRDVEGPKSVIILSQGLMLEGAHSEASSLAELAAQARATINVLMYDVPLGLASQSRISETVSQDRDLREGGLEALASRSRGSLFRVVANPQYVFDRLRSEISAYYMLGVEPTERDRDGKTHQIRVLVGRSGVQVRARRQVQYTVRTPNTWSREVLMGRVLRSPAPSTELPMRLSSYVYKDAEAGKVKLVLAAEIVPETMEKGLDLGVGFAVFDRVGAVAASGQERKIYSPNSDLPIRYDVTIALEPGRYRVRLAAIDLGGNSGSVEREVDAFRMDGQELAFGDLILTQMRDAKSGSLRPPVVLQVSDGQLATYTELYTNKPGALDEASVVFEVADTADGPALQSAVADFRERTDRTLRQALGIIPVAALPPGRYIARAIISTSGKTVGKLSRPFEVMPTATAKGAASAKEAAGAPGAIGAGGAPGAGGATGTSAAMASSTVVRGLGITAKPAPFSRDDVLKPDMLSAVFDAMDKNHPAAKGALSRARTGKLDGTALMALDAGDQSAGSIFRGLELLSKGQLDPAANQFGVALRNAPDTPIASFYLGACYAAAGRDREAVAAWERARAAQLQLPGMQAILANAWLRLGQPAQAVEPLREALEREPQNDQLRKNLAVAQSQLGLHEQAYPIITPFLERNPSDADALLVALHALYQVHVEGRTIGSAEQDKAQAATYARAYAAAKGTQLPLVEKWADFLSR
jgi:VWFA-related protein